MIIYYYTYIDKFICKKCQNKIEIFDLIITIFTVVKSWLAFKTCEFNYLVQVLQLGEIYIYMTQYIAVSSILQCFSRGSAQDLAAGVSQVLTPRAL